MPNEQTTSLQETSEEDRLSLAATTSIPRTNRTKVKCAICLADLAKLTNEHLRSHGYTMATYRRVWLCPTDPPRERTHDLRRGGSDPLAHAAAIVSDPQFIGGVADAIMHGPMRDRLTLSVTALLEVRARMHGEAVARLEALNAELHAPWRVAQGGPNGAPTPTKDLVLMVQSASIEVSKTEDLYMKAAKLAVDEAKGKDAAKLALPDGLDHFSGTAERLPVPTDITPAERESVRQLLSGLSQAINRRRARAQGATIDVVATAQVVGQGTTPTSTTPLVAAPMAIIGPPIPPLDQLATPMREADEPF